MSTEHPDGFRVCDKLPDRERTKKRTKKKRTKREQKPDPKDMKVNIYLLTEGQTVIAPYTKCFLEHSVVDN